MREHTPFNLTNSHWRFALKPRAMGVMGVLVAASLTSGCLGVGGGGGGGGDGGTEIPKGVDDFLEPEDIASLVEAGASINRGNDPPAMEAEWAVIGMTIRKDDQGQTGGVVPYTFRFYDQQANGAVKVSYASNPPTDTADGIGSFISGSDRCFSVFVDSRGDANGCNYRSPQILSGCLNAEGNVEGWELAFLMKEKSGQNCDALVPEGHRRVLKTDQITLRVGGTVPDPDPDTYTVADLAASCASYCDRELTCTPEEYNNDLRLCQVECQSDLQEVGPQLESLGCIGLMLRYNACRDALTCEERARHDHLESCDANGVCVQYPLMYCETEFCAMPQACNSDYENRCQR